MIKDDKVIVTYLKHSGFLVELEQAYLLFDYFQGVIPSLAKNKELFVFASHAHHDHYNPEIFQLQTLQNQVTYILSSDIDVASVNQERIVIKQVAPYESLRIHGFEIQTFKSTDEGVAFLVTTPQGMRIYHAGDLNWWHWKGESETYNQDMAMKYQHEIDLLTKSSHGVIDLAFVPVDPRLEEYAVYGLEYLKKEIVLKYVIPMHFWERYDELEKMLDIPEMANIYKRVIFYDKCGEVLKLGE